MKVKYNNIARNSVVIDGLYPLYFMFLHDNGTSHLQMGYTYLVQKYWTPSLNGNFSNKRVVCVV